MKRSDLVVFIAAFVLGCAAMGVRAADEPGQTGGMTGQSDAETVIKGWPAKSQAGAHDLMQKYGQPDTVNRDMLAWNDKAPWKRVAVYRKAIRANVTPSNANFVENMISYDVPGGKALDLKKFDHAFIIDTKKGTLAHRGETENENILALNLANDIVTGKRDVASAKEFRSKIKQESLAGKSSPYMEKLMFTPSGSSGENAPSEQTPSGNQPGTQPQQTNPPSGY